MLLASVRRRVSSGTTSARPVTFYSRRAFAVAAFIVFFIGRSPDTVRSLRSRHA